MSDTSLLVTPPGAVNPDDKAILAEAGVIVIETSNPAAIRFLRPGTELGDSDLIRAAATAIWGAPDHVKAAFATAIAKTILARPDPLPSRIKGSDDQ